MKMAVIYRPKNTPPPEAIPGMFERLGQWVEKYEGRMEALHFFAGGGGIGVMEVADATELQTILAEHPFTLFADVETRPVLDPATGLRTLREAFAQRS